MISLLKKSLPLAMLALALAISPAQAQKIRDVARLKNETPNKLIGMGLVVGLAGTGDGGDAQAINKLKAISEKLGDNLTTAKDLKNTKNIAVVELSVDIPAQGAHSGEKLDLIVSSTGTA